MGKKFVGLDGLKHFWTKAKSWITGQITAEVTAKIAEIVASAPEDLDTLKEIADWISAHVNDAAAMNTQINTNKNNIAALQTSVAGKAAAGHTHTKSEITDFPITASDVGAIEKSDLLDFVYPVGSIYMSVNNVSPQTFLGGTWIRINGRFLLGAGANTANTDNTYGSLAANQINRSVNEQGGEVTHKLTIAEMPSHSHKENIRRASDEASGYGATVSSAFQNRLIVDSSYDFGLDSSTKGNGSTHNNMPPYLVVYMWKRTA